MPLRDLAVTAKTVAGVVLFFLVLAWAAFKFWMVFT